MRRLPAVALLLVLASLVVPARASADEGILLRGSKTAYVDLYVYASTTITASDIRMSTKGSYVGFFMSPAPANRDTVGELLMPSVGATGATQNDVMQLGQSWDVRAGKYRVFLLTDGPAEVFVPITGQGLRGWAPRGRAPLAVRPFTMDVAPGQTAGVGRLPVDARVRSLVITAGLASSSSLTAVDTLDACVTASTSCTSHALAARVPAGKAWTYSVSFVSPGTYSGELDMNRVAGVDAGTHVDGAVLVLTIGLQK